MKMLKALLLEKLGNFNQTDIQSAHNNALLVYVNVKTMIEKQDRQRSNTKLRPQCKEKNLPC